MQWVKPRIKGWGRLNLVNNVEEKTFKGRRKHGMTRQANNQAFALGLA
jgi:hypothetical protein